MNNFGNQLASAVPIADVSIIGGEMECHYCGLGFTNGRLCQSNGHGYCDQSCLNAYIRDGTRLHLEQSLERFKKVITFKPSPEEEQIDMYHLFKKYSALVYLFYRGLLARQTKSQLNLLHEKITELSKEMFLAFDEVRTSFDDEDLLYFAECCSDKETVYRDRKSVV